MDNFVLIETPRVLWSEATGAPIDRCAVCKTNLLAPGVDHLIEKAFRGDALLFEYGLCGRCFDWLEESMSVSSRWLCDDWLSRQVDFEERFERLSREAPADAAPWIANCAVTKTPVAELDEYRIEAICKGTDLVLCHLPYVISGGVTGEMRGLLSSDSRRQLERFTRDYLGLPPALLRGNEPKLALVD